MLQRIPARQPGRNFLTNLTLAFSAVLIALLVSEGVVRIISAERDGQYFVRQIPLPPYHVNIGRMESVVKNFEDTPDSYQMYDPDLGWTNRPDSRSRDGLYTFNQAGIRADTDFSPAAPDGVLRIALFGDSFTHGSDVAFEQTWGQKLQRLLTESAIQAQVLNFGVHGYGMDQAYLRWQHEGQTFHPDLVIFGFNAENAYRNLNIVRPYYQSALRSQITQPFTKPRFVLVGGELQLVNSPAVPPDEIVALMADFENSPLSDYEYFYQSGYVDHWYFESRLIGLFIGLRDLRREAGINDKTRFLRLNGEAAQLALAIIGAFHADVTADGADFMIVHLPLPSDLDDLFYGRPLDYADLLNALDRQYVVIHPADDLDLKRRDEYFIPHYSPEANEVIAQAVFNEVRRWVQAHPEYQTGEGDGE